MKPNIIKLKKLMANYFDNNLAPQIIWKRLDEGVSGTADVENNIIYMNPVISMEDPFSTRIGHGRAYRPRVKIKIIPGEQYFVILLHEIGHFKVNVKASDELYKFKEKILESLHIEEEAARNFGVKVKQYNSEREWLEAKFQEIYDELRYMEDLLKALDKLHMSREDFMGFIYDNDPQQHKAVHKWAIREFQRQREKIQKLLKE